MTKKQKIIREIAFVLCEDRKYLPLALEPGDVPRVDGYLPNGDPGHYIYREFIPLAKKIYSVTVSQNCNCNIATGPEFHRLTPKAECDEFLEKSRQHGDGDVDR